jgi:hypothetical protein
MTKTEVEVITSAEPRRRWSAEEKRRIVSATRTNSSPNGIAARAPISFRSEVIGEGDVADFGRREQWSLLESEYQERTARRIPVFVAERS